MKSNKFTSLGLAALCAAGCGAAEWESPRTTRRYLNPPLAERMTVLWSDAKISLADVLHEKDWHKREYKDEIADACWFLRGPDARPFDFRTARNLISSDGVPSHGLEWTEDGVTVRLETVCDYVRKPTVFGRFAVQNGGKAPVVREYAVRVRHGNEAQLFGGLKNGPPDFYCAYASHPESWDAVPCDWTLGDGALQAESGGFMTFSQLPAGARWDAALGAVRFTLSLAAGETFAIDFAFGYGPRRDPAYDRTLAQANGRWRAELDRISRLPKSIRSNSARRRLVRHLTAQILQCLSLPVGRDYVLPRQGCLERGVWPWDCQEAMEALILIGDFNEYVEGVLAFFFDLYATGERYSGEENRGRIGPFLFDWDCNTANVIGMLGRYCAATGNRTLWERYRVRALDGFRWVLAHRVKPESANGMIPGVFPPGRATDSNPSKRHRHVQPWEWTDVLNLDGIEHLLAAAEKFDDPAKGEVRAGYEDYLATVRKLMAEKLAANANGAEYRLQSYLDNNGRTMYKPNKTGYWLNWAVRHGLCSEQEVVRAWRECLAGGVVSDKGLCYIFPVRDNRHYWYTTSMEKHWHHLLRQAGQDELADKVLNGVLRYAMTQDLCVGERYCDNDPWYLPWSPNASGSGRIIQMLLEAK